MAEHTFYTVKLPLSFEEAAALNNYHFSLSPSTVLHGLTSEQEKSLQRLEERIDELLSRDQKFANGGFIKLNTRSPKVRSLSQEERITD